MNLPENPSEDFFSTGQIDLLRIGLQEYKHSVKTGNRGGDLSWECVAEDIQNSDAYESVIVELFEAEKPELSYRETKSDFQLAPEDKDKAEDRWPVLGKKLQRFVDGEKSRTTGRRELSEPKAWVLRVIYKFLLEKGPLPAYFEEKGIENYSAAFALLNYFKIGKNDSAFQKRSFTGVFHAKKNTPEDVRPKELRFERFPDHSFYQVRGAFSHQTAAAPDNLKISGWAIVPPGDGLLLFLSARVGQDALQRVYVTHFLQVQDGRVLEFSMSTYEAQVSHQSTPPIKKDHGESMLFINSMPVSFDRVDKVVKVFKKRKMRGEAARILSYAQENDREERMPKRSLDIEFLYAVCEGNVSKVERLIESVTDINIRVGGTEGTALHVIAQYQLKDVFKVLRRRQDLNYLVKDNEGRLPSHVAMAAYNNVGLGLYLLRKERQQARREGIDYRAWAFER